MTDYGFYTEQEIKELADSDLSFEISDTALLKNTRSRWIHESAYYWTETSQLLIMNKFPTNEEILQMCREKYSELTDADDEFFLDNPVLWPFDWVSPLYCW